MESRLVSLKDNLVDLVWTDRLARPANAIFPLDLKFAGASPGAHGAYSPALTFPGESHVHKIERLREEMKKKEVHAIVVNMLDEVAWLFNLRGSDIEYNPGTSQFPSTSSCLLTIRCSVFFAYAVLTPEKAQLFLNPVQVTDDLRQHLGEHVDIHPYDTFFSYLSDLGAEIGLHKKSVWLLASCTYPRRRLIHNVS